MKTYDITLDAIKLTKQPTAQQLNLNEFPNPGKLSKTPVK
jgi:hypothetical protein